MKDKRFDRCLVCGKILVNGKWVDPDLGYHYVTDGTVCDPCFKDDFDETREDSFTLDQP